MWFKKKIQTTLLKVERLDQTSSKEYHVDPVSKRA